MNILPGMCTQHFIPFTARKCKHRSTARGKGAPASAGAHKFLCRLPTVYIHHPWIVGNILCWICLHSEGASIVTQNQIQCVVGCTHVFCHFVCLWERGTGYNLESYQYFWLASVSFVLTFAEEKWTFREKKCWLLQLLNQPISAAVVPGGQSWSERGKCVNEEAHDKLCLAANKPV